MKKGRVVGCVQGTSETGAVYVDLGMGIENDMIFEVCFSEASPCDVTASESIQGLQRRRVYAQT